MLQDRAVFAESASTWRDRSPRAPDCRAPHRNTAESAGGRRYSTAGADAAPAAENCSLRRTVHAVDRFLEVERHLAALDYQPRQDVFEVAGVKAPQQIEAIAEAASLPDPSSSAVAALRCRRWRARTPARARVRRPVQPRSATVRDSMRSPPAARCSATQRAFSNHRDICRVLQPAPGSACRSRSAGCSVRCGPSADPRHLRPIPAASDAAAPVRQGIRRR